MSILRLPVAMVLSAHQYQARVSGQITVGEIARYLAQIEAQIEATTLEIVRPARPNQRMDELDIQGGDRFLIFTHQSRPLDLPTPLRAGDKIALFTQGDTRLSSQGKPSLMVGKPEAGFMPDIDLRRFIAPRMLEFIAADCLRLYFDDHARVWYAARSGQTRITLDELELGTQPIALNDAQWMRFYRPGDAQPITEVRLTLETVGVGESFQSLPSGSQRITLQIGMEQESQTLRASENIRAGQISASLAQYHQVTLHDELRFGIGRLVAPQTPLDGLRIGEGDWLYAAIKGQHAPLVLTLRDVHQHDRVFPLMATPEERVIGCRAEANRLQPDLDIDLYEAITGQGIDPRPFQGMSPYYARVSYQADTQSWWIRPDERSQVPLFVNNARAGRSAALPLTGGDVISIGPSLSHYYARLEAVVGG